MCMYVCMYVCMYNHCSSSFCPPVYFSVLLAILLDLNKYMYVCMYVLYLFKLL